jgi:Protein of unknown function (DUF3866)
MLGRAGMGDSALSVYRRAKVVSVEAWGTGAQLAELIFDDGAEGPALIFEKLTGRVDEGDEVIVNTTAVDLKLGTGGYHFILWNLSRSNVDTGAAGHIMKLRYTPLQLNVEAAEEGMGVMELDELETALEGMPVVAGSLHSQLLPAALAYKSARPEGRLVYVMTDGGSLPAQFSKTVMFVREEGLVDSVITCGHAFGGDLEAVNIFGALLTARNVCNADAAVVMMGPGIVGTGSAVGFSGMEQAGVINASASLGGTPIAILRIMFADARERHRGLSHHTISALRVGARARAIIPLPVLDVVRRNTLLDQLRRSGIEGAHEIREIEADFVLELLRQCCFKVTVMSRSIEEEPEYFMAAGAAGLLAAQIGGE